MSKKKIEVILPKAERIAELLERVHHLELKNEKLVRELTFRDQIIRQQTIKLVKVQNALSE